MHESLTLQYPQNVTHSESVTTPLAFLVKWEVGAEHAQTFSADLPPPSCLDVMLDMSPNQINSRSLFKERSDYSKLAKNSTSVLWEMEWLHIEAQYVMTPLARS